MRDKITFSLSLVAVAYIVSGLLTTDDPISVLLWLVALGMAASLAVVSRGDRLTALVSVVFIGTGTALVTLIVDRRPVQMLVMFTVLVALLLVLEVVREGRQHE